MSEEICQHKYCAIPNMQTKLGLPDLYKIQKKLLQNPVCNTNSGFDLTFQKWLVSFTNEKNCKTNPKCCPPWLCQKTFFTLDRQKWP